MPPDPYTFLEVDLSQAELRIVAWLANETKLIELMERGEDVHKYTADRVSELSGLQCPRQLGKRINHASNYGMGPAKFADSCLMESNLSISVSNAAMLLQARARTFPAIPIWHQSIENQLRRTRCLTSPHGRSRYFYGPIVTDEMIREALSFIPQATVVDTVNAAWVELAKQAGYGTDFYVTAQIHDSLLLNVRQSKLKSTLATVHCIFDAQHVTINGITRVIPHDCKTGQNWSKMEPIT